jgi:hypothetical protein
MSLAAPLGLVQSITSAAVLPFFGVVLLDGQGRVIQHFFTLLEFKLVFLYREDVAVPEMSVNYSNVRIKIEVVPHTVLQFSTFLPTRQTGC